MCVCVFVCICVCMCVRTYVCVGVDECGVGCEPMSAVCTWFDLMDMQPFFYSLSFIKLK